jgi:phage protein D
MSFFPDTIEKEPKTGFYAPDFEIEIEGKAIDRPTKVDVLSIKVTLEIEKIAGATIKFNNWDDRKVAFKYSDKPEWFVDSRVQLKVGYRDYLVPLVVGQINSVAPDFPEKGASTLTIGVQDKLQILKDRKPAPGDKRQFKGTASEIAEEIAKRNNLATDTDPGGVTHDNVVQGDEDDATFLLKLAHRNNFDCYVYVDANHKDKLRFGARRRAVEHKLKWRESLRSFTPTLTMSGQVSKVTVRGWNIDKKEAVIGEAVAADLEKASGTTGADKAKTAVANRQEVVIGASVETEEEAKALAKSLLENRVNAFVTGKGSLIGRPDIRPGDTVSISELGTLFSGIYDVIKVEHQLDDKGFSTTFDVTKAHVQEEKK